MSVLHFVDLNSGPPMFIKTGPPPSPPEVTGLKRHSMGVITDNGSVSRVSKRDRRRRSPQHNSGRRARSKTDAGTINVAFKRDVPDIKIGEHAFSDDEMSV